jgi:hypothetical protein
MYCTLSVSEVNKVLKDILILSEAPLIAIIDTRVDQLKIGPRKIFALKLS